MKNAKTVRFARRAGWLAVAGVVGTAGLAGALPALAQQTQKVEKVEVTGSSIKRIDGETALPVQIIKREDIERIGATTTEELMKSITAITSAGGVFSTQANGTVTTSQSTVSLRGLGSTRTLVLVNGRRVAVFGGTTSIAVDVNSIPISAIERIEVLKDGASSLYGSDAIAGVINFILRKDYTGAEVRISGGEPTRSGGGNQGEVTVFAGFGDLAKDRYNVTLGGGYLKIDEIRGKDRDFAHQFNVGELNDLSSSIAFPGNILYGPTFARLGSPAYPNCPPLGIVSPFASASSPTQCKFENSPFLSVLPGQEKTHFIASARFAFNADTEAYFEGAFTRNKFDYFTQPVPISEATALIPSNPYNAFLANLINTQYPTLPAGLRRFSTANNTLVLLPPGSPYYPTAYVASLGLPTNQPIAFRYRDFANGLRETEDRSDNIRILGGLKGTIANWDYDSAVSYSESKAGSNLKAGYPLYSLFLPILDSGIINPFGDTGPAGVAAAQAAEFHGDIYTSKTSTAGIDAKATRELWQMSAGPAALALGGEYREEKFAFSPSQAYQIGDIAGFGGNILPVDKSRYVYSAYAELAIPILKGLEADFGVRYDNYETVGSTTNPKASIRWTPTRTMLFRGSVGSGFRAPSLTDLYQPQATSVTPNGTRDPLRCPNPATGAPSDCNNQFPTLIGGNPDLKPEKSITSTLGAVFEPSRNFSFGVDAYWIQLKDSIVIGGLNSTFILANAANATQYASYLIRGAPDGNPSGLGPIQFVLQNTSNLFKVRTSGYDVTMKAKPFQDEGYPLLLTLDGTYVWEYKRQNADGSYTPQVDNALVAAGGVIPRWHHVATASYAWGPFGVALTQNFQKGYHDVRGNFSTTDRLVGSYETFDLQGTWSGWRTLKFTLGVKNVLDRDPPYTNEGGQFAAGYDITYSDVRGRFVYGSVVYTFK